MGFTEEYLALQKKKKKDKDKEKATKKTGHSFTDEYLSLQSTSKEEDIAPTKPLFTRKTTAFFDEDIAPVMPTVGTAAEQEEDERKWFQKGAFEDGWQKGDLWKTILGTTTDVFENVGAGIMGMGEKAVDALAYVAPLFAQGQFYQNGGGYQPVEVQQAFNESIEQSKKGLSEFIEKDLYDEEEIAKKIVIGTDKNSVLGEKSGALVQSAGQLAATIGLQAAGVPWFLTTGVTSFGSEAEAALNEGADYEEAGVSAAVTTGAEILTEKLGGISFGGATFDDKIVKQLARAISNKFVRNGLALGVKGSFEAGEEWISNAISEFGQSLTYADPTTVKELLFDEEALDSAIGGFLLGSTFSGVDAVKSGRKGVDYASGLTANEQKVVDKVYKDEIAQREQDGKKLTEREKSKIYDEVLNEMENGYISTDTIEEVLGGETYKTYQDTIKSEDALQEEFKTLNQMKQSDMTGEQIDRRNELKQQLEDIKQNGLRDQYKTKLNDEVMSLVQNDRLSESYNERARRGQVFTADLSKYDAKQQATIQKAIDSGILNNTNRTHEFVDLIAKISADKGVPFGFTNNERLKESGVAVDGKTVNGYVTKDGVMLNIDSAKALNSVVGHEITHVLEGTEFYTELSGAIKNYAISKNGLEAFNARLKETETRYKGIGDPDMELTADLVGEYLFTDEGFVRNLSVQHRNVFQKIYDEIKYLCKVATAGSKEARELEKVKRAFEKAYRAEKNTADDGSVKLNISRTQNMSWAEQINGALYDGNNIRRNDTLVVGNPAETSVANDIENKPLAIPLSVLTKASNGKDISHSIKRGKLAKLDEGIKNAPITIVNPDRNAVVYVTDITQGGLPVVAAFDMNATFDGDNVHKATSIHLQVDVQTMLESLPESATVYARKNELDPVGATNNLRGLAAKIKFIEGNIAQENKDVKFSLSDSDGKRLTAEQQDYFKDSKVRDENGNLKVMYHGTGADFTVFGRDHIGENFPNRGGDLGFYFTPDYDTARGYASNAGEAGRIESVYLNLKNPLIVEDEGWGSAIAQADARHSDLMRWAKAGKHDGIIVKSTDYEIDDNGNVDTVYVAFEPNQIKRTDNEKPTADKDIRYSLSDSDGKQLSKEQQEFELTALKQERSEIEDQLDMAFFNDLSDAEIRKLNNRLVKVNADIDKIVAEERKATVKTSMREILDNLSNYRRSDLESLAEQISEGAWDDYGELSRSELEDGLREAIQNRELSSLEMQSKKFGLWVRPVETADKDIRYSLADSEGRELSPAVQKRFGNSKVVDENGSLKVVYHGTATGEFSIFDKSKGSVEGDFGSGFYFTDNEADVSEHYEGGGPDFDNKVGRRADQIWGEEDEIEYEEAERRAREELFKGSHKFEVYLNIENPAIVGETMLLDGESIYEQYNEEDYDDYDDYLADLNQAFADEIDNIIWDIDRNVDIDSTDGIAEVLYEALAEGGIGLEELKAKLNNLYLEDSNGNLVGNEVARQIIESLGYDGIIDPTVSGKWNMDIEEGTTHYIVFKPNQIKAVTNENPTDNPDIHRSLSEDGEQAAPVGNYNVYGKDIALETAPVQEETVAENATVEELFPDDFAPIADDPERFDSLTDADAPPEMEAPYSAAQDEYVDDPFEERDYSDVGKRNVKAYMYENPEVKPFFQMEANAMLGDLRNSTRGERIYNGEVYYATGGEKGWDGTKRHTTDDIAYLLDSGYTYAEIEKGLNAIIEDHGAENNAVSKRIEFALNDRLLNGYNDVEGRPIPANEGYIKLLGEKQITEYSQEAFEAFMANADAYAPAVTEESAAVEDIAPIAEKYEAIKPKPTREPRMAKATPAEQARAEIMVEEPKVDKKKPTAWNLFKDNFVDKGTVFETLSLKTGNRELQGRWKSIGRAESSAQWFMEHGNAEASSLKSIRETVEKSGKTQQFYEYLYHQHNVDRMNLEDRYDDMENKPVFGYGVTSDISKAEAVKLEKANPEFKDWANSVYSYMTTLREMMADNGVISRETAKLWAEMYPHYVPVRRKGDDGLNINVALDTKRTGVNAPVKKATGGNRDILPLFDTMAMRTEQTFKAIAKNRFGVELKNLIAPNVKAEAVDIDEIIDSVDSHEELLQEGKDGKNPTFTVFENGEKVTFEITDEMYDTMKPKSKAMSYTNKVLNTANNVRRGLLTEYNPAFMLTNPIKDTQDVLMNSQHPARTYASYPRAMAELLGKKGQYYQEYMEHGGEMNTYFDGESKTFVKEKSGLSKAIGFPLEKISQANNFIERVPRMAEYIASRKMGHSIDVAMLDAARVTTDFSAGGDLVKLANRNGFTFLNASVQGAAQQVRNVREAKAEGLKGWAKLAAKVAAAGLPSILLNHLLWDDDEEYAELSDYVKQNYYIVGKYGDGKFVRIPKGRALAVIQSGFEQMENLITGNDEADFNAFAELVISNLAPNNPLENNLLAPIMQAYNNETWYGDDLVPTRLQDLPAAEQFDETTDALSKWLGEKTNISPYKINYVLDQYSGGVGDMLLPMMTQEAERGDNTLLAPILDKFTTDSVMKNQNVSDFYDKKDELTMNANASGAADEDVLKNKYMNSVNADLAKLYAQKREIQNSDMPDAEKYAAVRDVQKQIVELTKEALDSYDDISYEDDYREGGKYARMNGKLYKLTDEGEWTKLSAEQATKYEVTRAAGDAAYATDGTNHYRWYVPGEDASADAEPGWKKITEKELERQEEVTSGLGISPEDYWENKEEYSYAFDNPENYAVAKAVGGYDAYKGYSDALYDIKADKDRNGKSISGSRKEKVQAYINNLDADYYTKIILWKSEYTSDDSHNYEIIDYLNSRNDISFDEMVAILRKLGFDVTDQGDISW